MGLLQSQLDFYAAQLERSNKPPVRLAENPSAIEAARTYLRDAGGIEQQLRSILTQLNQQVRPLSVMENAEEYRSVLNGNADVPGAFTKRGYDLFDDLTAKVGNSAGEACVMGNRDRVESTINAVDSRARGRLKSLYLREYADAWKDFLASYSVIPYIDPRDAVTRLGKLSDSRSPLLGIVQLIAVNTNFPPAKAGEVGLLEKGAQVLGIRADAARAEKKATEARKFLDADNRQMTPADVALLFQPVLFTTPPDAHVIVNDHNGQYVDGLRKLQAGLESLVQASASEQPTAISQAHGASVQARNAREALADKFNIGNEGVSKQLADLLDQPIRQADRFIPAPRDLSQTKNRDLALFCRDMAPILNKYPFNPTTPIGASTSDLSSGFAPMTGKVQKYALDKAADLVSRTGTKWDRNPSWQGPRVTQDLVNFLNQAQLFTNALFTEAGVLQLRYTLRPSGSVPVLLVLDGTKIRSSESSFQKEFHWPAQNGEKQGAEGLVDVQGGAGFGKFDDFWGIFHLFQNADERAPRQTVVTWSENRGKGGAVLQKINPPARVEFVEFPGGVDLFNPKFFEALSCPGKAVIVN
jgi:type VI secretion system protein ImpL